MDSEPHRRRNGMTYQEVTGSLMANTHPGGVTGQDACNDMLVTATAQEYQKHLIQATGKGLEQGMERNANYWRSTQPGGVETS